MDYWEGPARWINTILLIIVAFVGFDTLFRLLNANEENVIVGTVAAVAGLFLAPFEGMFPDQEFLLTAIIAVLGYSLLAGIALAVTRSVQTTRRARAHRRAEERGAPGARPESRGRPTPDTSARAAAETTRPLGPPPGDGADEATAPDSGDATIPLDDGPGARDAEATQPTRPRGERDFRSDSDSDRTQRLS